MQGDELILKIQGGLRNRIRKLNRLTAWQKQKRARKERLFRQRLKEAIGSGRIRSSHDRRNFLAGALILEMVETGEWSADDLNKMIDEALTKNEDRALFGLPPLPQNSDSD